MSSRRPTGEALRLFSAEEEKFVDSADLRRKAGVAMATAKWFRIEETRSCPDRLRHLQSLADNRSKVFRSAIRPVGEGGLLALVEIKGRALGMRAACKLLGCPREKE